MLSMAPLLMHSPDLPSSLRDELRAAFAQPERRDDHLTAAARIMRDQLDLSCGDARELVGLPPGGC